MRYFKMAIFCCKGYAIKLKTKKVQMIQACDKDSDLENAKQTSVTTVTQTVK